MPTVLKCKMCGGDIATAPDMTVGTCLFCGSTMTLPRIDSEKKARLFNRANQYRLNNEFDKAFDAYEAIVQEDEQESEAYWGLLLSEYGVEYVTDPRSGKKVPTCHRTHVKPIRSSVNYERACRYADAESRMLYQDEAEELDRIQRGIIAISEKEPPYDVFICYKESEDDSGERTADSVLAQTIYDELENLEIRTFFSRITLENKLGQDYEPYIYSALKNAKVMLVVATTGAHCEAVWVKNEWKRYLGFMEEDKSKILIPVFQDMSPYEFPLELSKYQSQDMGKLGAMQDLIRGIKKLVGDKDKTTLDSVALHEFLQAQERKAKRQKLRKLIGTLILILAVMFFFIAKRVGWISFDLLNKLIPSEIVETVSETPQATIVAQDNSTASSESSDTRIAVQTQGMGAADIDSNENRAEVSDFSINSDGSIIDVAFNYSVPENYAYSLKLSKNASMTYPADFGGDISGSGSAAETFTNYRESRLETGTTYYITLEIGPANEDGPGCSEVVCKLGPVPITIGSGYYMSGSDVSDITLGFGSVLGIPTGSSLDVNTIGNNPITVWNGNHQITDFEVSNTDDSVCTVTNENGVLVIKDLKEGVSVFTVSYEGAVAAFSWYVY